MNKVLENAVARWFPGTTAYIRGRNQRLEDENWHLRESLNRIELEIENEGYHRLTQLGESQFNRKRLGDIVKLAIQMAMKNPITNRSVNVQADYVFGQGVTFVAKHPIVQQVVDEFLKYPGNQKTLTSHTAMLQREKDLQVYGNLFLAMYTNANTGRVIVRCIDTLEVTDIIRNPEDKDEEWYIKRTFDDGTVSLRTVYHQSLSIAGQKGLPLPWDISPDHAKGDIVANAPVLHVMFNVFGKEKFAIPEVYPQLDWALAYKRFLEDWTSIIRAYARMAMKVTGLSGKKQAAAAKSILQTSVSLSNPIEKNPSPVGGSVGLFGKGVDMEPVKTAGATTPASEGGPILNMAAAGVGLPNTFYGDASSGNYATAKTLDRPTELKMRSRQKLWQETLELVIAYVVMQAAIASDGIIQGAEITTAVDVFSGLVMPTVEMPYNDDEQYGPVNEPINSAVDIHFPEILERNVTDRVRALVNACTLFGKQLTDIIPDKRLVARLMLEALNVENIDAYIPAFVKMWSENLKAADKKDNNGKPVNAYTIPASMPQPTSLPLGKKGKGAEDPSQGGAVGANG